MLYIYLALDFFWFLNFGSGFHSCTNYFRTLTFKQFERNRKVLKGNVSGHCKIKIILTCLRTLCELLSGMLLSFDNW